jgi:hypothetical protein
MAAFCANNGDYTSAVIASSQRVATTMEATIAEQEHF